MSTGGAFSVAQCVAKRTRQLDRLLFMLESTATKFEHVKSPPSCTDSVVFSSSTGVQVQKRYAKMLLDFLDKEQGLRVPALFADSIHLESYDEELQQQLVLAEDEELLRQRVVGTWDFLVATSIDQDIAALVRACECLWNDLLPQTSSVLPQINSMRGDPDTSSWLRNTEAACTVVHPWPSAVQETMSS
ncbi:hypothetical protein PHYPSEUDO_009352 [Phytophthora pseudosyringae]|uniref:Uncharacterized protein n=1 Tax=Phytophthora pseudosyringae TaxID=221518 RepID=A0A8T1WE08_9STRA|nr:hypothetical protein PHYPSEUDO_009352 [Phytophthora pseudosyringae]